MFLLSLCYAGDVQKIQHSCQNGTCPSFIQFKNQLGSHGSKMAIKDRTKKRRDLGYAVTGKKGCEDHTFKKKEKWHDSDGPKYDCQWYQEDNRCKTFGDGYENEGLTANEACCACGGGWTPTTTSTTNTFTNATYDYIQGETDCVWVKNSRQNLSAVEFSFKVKNWGNDWYRRPLYDAYWYKPKPLIMIQIDSQSFDTAGKKNGIEYFNKWHLRFNMWFLSGFEEKVEFSTPFEFSHEYDVKILFSAELDKVKLFVHGEETEDQKFTTPLDWMEVGGGMIGCNTFKERPFFGSVTSFKTGPSMDLLP